MANPNITGLCFMRLRDAHGYMGRVRRALFVNTSVGYNTSVGTRLPFINGVGHGRIVSISRGSPPPKLR